MRQRKAFDKAKSLSVIFQQIQALCETDVRFAASMHDAGLTEPVAELVGSVLAPDGDGTSEMALDAVVQCIQVLMQAYVADATFETKKVLNQLAASGPAMLIQNAEV